MPGPHLLPLASLVAALSMTAGAYDARATQPRAVIELFTSQGCSSCPRADAVLEELAKNPDTIALSLPVDYWDYLGWKDTLASPAFTARQRAYSASRGDGEVYTPQVVVNGQSHVIGSNRAAIEMAIDVKSASSPHVPISVSQDAINIKINVGAARSNDPETASVVLMPVYASRDVAIGRGENARRTVRYVNVVRRIIPVARWNGKGLSANVPLSKLDDAEGYVVLLQADSEGKPGAILGAATSLSPKS